MKGGNKVGLNQTPMSERTHIGFFGKRNAGKSSVMNASAAGAGSHDGYAGD